MYAFVAIQWSAVVDWITWNINERWFHCTFGSGLVHDVPAGEIQKCKQHTNGNVVTGGPLTSRQGFWVFLKKCGVTLNEAKALLRAVGHEREEDEPSSERGFEDRLAFDDDGKDDWVLWHIILSFMIEVQASLRNKLSTIQENCRLYGLNELINTGGDFNSSLSRVVTVITHHEVLEWLAQAQAFAQKLQNLAPRLQNANLVALTMRKELTGLHGEFADVGRQVEPDLDVLLTRDDVGKHMHYAAVWNRTNV